MNLTIDTLKKTQAKLGYKWFEDQPNIIGIRTTLSIPDVFNDLLCIVYKDADNKEQLFTALITTEPGTYYQKKILNPNGCAVLQPGQYINAYKIGVHKDQKALVQVGSVSVKRDKDLNGIAGDSGTLDKGLFGLNIHGAVKLTLTKLIGPWSAGCQVHADWNKKEEMVAICSKYQAVNKGLLTYTLLTESQLCQ